MASGAAGFLSLCVNDDDTVVWGGRRKGSEIRGMGKD